MLTLVIPFLNEGENLSRTLENIRTTAGDDIEILCINDASNDDVDYHAIVTAFGARYIENPQRLGVAACRDLGATLTTSPFLLFLDAHMQFYDACWVERITHVLETAPRTVWCAQSVPLNTHWQLKSDCSVGFGAFATLERSVRYPMMACHFLNRLLPEGKVPCIYGAAYAVTREYYQHLGGLSGLQQFGGDELYLSLKVWLEGGQCRVLSDVQVGHVYREQFPYAVENRMFSFNKLLIARTLFPERILAAYEQALAISLPDYAAASALADKCVGTLGALRAQYARTFDLDRYFSFARFNSTVRGAVDAL